MIWDRYCSTSMLFKPPITNAHSAMSVTGKS